MNELKKDKDETNAGGVILILIGIVALLWNFDRIPQFDNIELLLLPALSVLFISAGVLTRKAGLFIPGGILSGVGLGVILESNAFGWTQFVDMPEGAPFMLAFALGWFSITFMTALFSDKTQWWALIPAAIFTLISCAILYGGIFEATLRMAGRIWPGVLIIIGIKAFLSGNHDSDHKSKLQ